MTIILLITLWVVALLSGLAFIYHKWKVADLKIDIEYWQEMATIEANYGRQVEARYEKAIAGWEQATQERGEFIKAVAKHLQIDIPTTTPIEGQPI